MGKVTIKELSCRLAFSLEEKEEFTKDVIQQWYEYWDGKVYVSFSGGKDSIVLLHQVRKLYPEVPAVFVDTGLEYPEIRSFVKTIDNVIWLRPKITFHKVIKKYGYPVVSKENAQKIYEIRNTKSEKLRSKRLYGDSKGNGKLPEKWKYLIDAPFKIHNYCCIVLKKRPIYKYEKLSNRAAIVGIMTTDSRLRKISYLEKGCNSFESVRSMSTPIAIWKESNIWEYIKKYNISYSKIYDMGYDRTGCMFCMFGLHMEKGENRFQRMARTHSKQYKYCIEKLGLGEVLDYLKLSYKPVQGFLPQEVLEKNCKLSEEPLIHVTE